MAWWHSLAFFFFFFFFFLSCFDLFVVLGGSCRELLLHWLGIEELALTLVSWHVCCLSRCIFIVIGRLFNAIVAFCGHLSILISPSPCYRIAITLSSCTTSSHMSLSVCLSVCLSLSLSLSLSLCVNARMINSTKEHALLEATIQTEKAQISLCIRTGSGAALSTTCNILIKSCKHIQRNI